MTFAFWSFRLLFFLLSLSLSLSLSSSPSHCRKCAIHNLALVSILKHSFACFCSFSPLCVGFFYQKCVCIFLFFAPLAFKRTKFRPGRRRAASKQNRKKAEHRAPDSKQIGHQMNARCGEGGKTKQFKNREQNLLACRTWTVTRKQPKTEAIHFK